MFLYLVNCGIKEHRNFSFVVRSIRDVTQRTECECRSDDDAPVVDNPVEDVDDEQ